MSNVTLRWLVGCSSAIGRRPIKYHPPSSYRQAAEGFFDLVRAMNGGFMSKKGHYSGGHSLSGTSVGFAGWGVKDKKKTKETYSGPGLAGMAPAVDEAARFTLIKASDLPSKPKLGRRPAKKHAKHRPKGLIGKRAAKRPGK